MKTLEIQNYRRDAVTYASNGRFFEHNFNHDYQLILLQGNEINDVKQYIQQYYRVISQYELIWTRRKLSENQRRLGIQAPTLAERRDQDTVKLHVLFFEIKSPEYYCNGSGLYQINWAPSFEDGLTDNVFLISDSIERFFYCATLLIGPEFMDDLIPGSRTATRIVGRTDLEGSGGWKTFHRMISVVNACSDWVVLRNAEFLPDNFWGNDTDIDILCRELGSFVSAVNAKKLGTGLSNYTTVVHAKEVNIDARFLGDDYYDRLWQHDMLSTKCYIGLVPILSIENHFFSLLYHARIHKRVVKPVYVSRLADMANSMGFVFDKRLLFDDKLCANFMDAYFNNTGYRFTYPYDYACYENINRQVTSHLVHIKPMCLSWVLSLRRLKRFLINLVRKFLPARLDLLIKRGLRK